MNPVSLSSVLTTRTTTQVAQVEPPGGGTITRRFAGSRGCRNTTVNVWLPKSQSVGFFSQKLCWSGSGVMDRIHTGNRCRGRSEQSVEPSTFNCCCCCCWWCGRHTCYTFPGMWRWREYKHPGATKNAHTHTHRLDKKGSKCNRPHGTHNRTRNLHSGFIVFTAYHNTFQNILSTSHNTNTHTHIHTFAQQR